jgi:hypothetical protein
MSKILPVFPSLSLAFVVVLSLGCDSKPAPAADPKADAKAQEDAEAKARIEKRKQEREAKEAAAKKEAEDIAAKIQQVTVIPDGTKIPKKIGEACEQVVAAQTGFMKKFHPQIEAAALTTQTGLLRKQCTDMNKPKVAMCQKFALEATDELLQKSINEYLPACMAKYDKE